MQKILIIKKDYLINSTQQKALLKSVNRLAIAWKMFSHKNQNFYLNIYKGPLQINKIKKPRKMNKRLKQAMYRRDYIKSPVNIRKDSPAHQ